MATLVFILLNKIALREIGRISFGSFKTSYIFYKRDQIVGRAPLALTKLRCLYKKEGFHQKGWTERGFKEVERN